MGSSTVSLLAPDFTLQGDTIIFFITGLEKQARPGHIRTEHYLRETESHRDYFETAEGYRPKGLFIANTKPYQSILPSTLAKWMLRVMTSAGIDTSHYKAHSSRSASASDLKKKGFSLHQILQRANWTQAKTFSTFYDRA